MASDTASLQNTGSASQKKLQPILEFVKRNLPTILAALCVIMIFLAGMLVYLLITQTFEHEFSCAYLIDRSLLGSEPSGNEFSFCNGAGLPFPGLTLIDKTDIFGYFTIPKIGWDAFTIPILPAFNPINEPLRKARLFVAWNIVIAFALISAVLTYIAVKVKGFVEDMMDPQKRQVILQNISIYLVIFAVISSLFYFTIVANH
jgi:hypothetical protein